jgi:hypothetical protein
MNALPTAEAKLAVATGHAKAKKKMWVSGFFL